MMSNRARTYVIEESDTCGDGDLLLVSRAGLAVKVDRYLDLGLVRLALNSSCSGCHIGAFMRGAVSF